MNTVRMHHWDMRDIRAAFNRHGQKICKLHDRGGLVLQACQADTQSTVLALADRP